jgi:hypothetical protein
MALTMGDMAMQSTDPLERGVIKRFTTTSDLAKVMTWKKIQGSTYKYRLEEQLSGISWRRVNEAYPESTGVISPRQEELKIIGGEFFIDKALVRLSRRGGDSIDLVAEQADMKARALARELERAFFEGDDLVDPDEMTGLRRRLTGAQVIDASAAGTPGTGGVLTQGHVDTLLDAIAMDVGSVHIFTSKVVRRKFTTIVNTATGAVRINYTDIDKLGKQIQAYDGIPIHVVEDDWDASTILDAEDPGDGTADTYSMYAVAFGDQGVTGLVNGDGPLVDCYRVTDETESGPPGEKWRCECYPGMAIHHPRAAARLRAILVV